MSFYCHLRVGICHSSFLIVQPRKKLFLKNHSNGSKGSKDKEGNRAVYQRRRGSPVIKYIDTFIN